GRPAVPEPDEPAVEPAPRPPHGFGLGEPLHRLPPTAQREPAARTGPEPATEVPARPLLGDDPLQPQTAAEPVEEAPTEQQAASDTPREARAGSGPPVVQRVADEGPPVPVAGPEVPLIGERPVPLFSGVTPPAPRSAPQRSADVAETV